MEMDSESAEGVKSDNPLNTGAALTREQVMAQRAEKKKLKEAKKNKQSAIPGVGGNDAGPPDQKQAPPKTKENSEQKQQKDPQPQPSGTPKSNKVTKSQQQQNEKSQAHPPPKNVTTVSSTPPISQSEHITKTPAQKGVSTTTAATPSVPVIGTVKSLPSTTKTEALDRSVVGTKSTVEFQSTIQSLFQVKKKPEVAKDKKFQLHPLFHSLGVRLRHNVIRGTNQRCVALLNTIKDYVQFYQTPAGMTFKHGLSTDLQTHLDALREKCPFAIGMSNAVEFITAYLCKMEQDTGDVRQQKEEIIDVIDQYIAENIEKAVEAIVMHGVEKVRTGDVIMLYSITEAVLSLLEKATEETGEDMQLRTFELIIIQTPDTILDIPRLLKKLRVPIQKQQIRISYINFSNAIYRMRHCTKLLIGGHGLFTTGGVMAQSGSGKLALLAATYNKPALFLCETYKFCDRSPLDFFTLDEYIPDHSVAEGDPFEPKIKYDVTPANLVTVVITDIDMLPSTSVPVVLRVQEGRAPRKMEESAECS